MSDDEDYRDAAIWIKIETTHRPMIKIFQKTLEVITPED